MPRILQFLSQNILINEHGIWNKNYEHNPKLHSHFENRT